MQRRLISLFLVVSVVCLYLGFSDTYAASYEEGRLGSYSVHGYSKIENGVGKAGTYIESMYLGVTVSASCDEYSYSSHSLSIRSGEASGPHEKNVEFSPSNMSSIILQVYKIKQDNP